MTAEWIAPVPEVFPRPAEQAAPGPAEIAAAWQALEGHPAYARLRAHAEQHAAPLPDHGLCQGDRMCIDCKAAEAEREAERWDDAAAEDLAGVQAERDGLKTAIAKVRADCRLMAGDQPPADAEHTMWLAGSRAQATRVLNILAALGVEAEDQRGDVT